VQHPFLSSGGLPKAKTRSTPASDTYPIERRRDKSIPLSNLVLHAMKHHTGDTIHPSITSPTFKNC
jgi:hypothetical protein